MTPGSNADRSANRWPLWALWILLSIAVLLSVRVLPWQQVLDRLRHLQGFWLAIAIAANCLILPLWALEWRVLSPRASAPSFREMFDVVAVTASVLNSVPFFAGEAAAVGLLVTRARLSRGAALSVLAMDQLLVGFAKLVVIAAATIFAPLPIWMRSGLASVIGGVGMLLIVLFALAHRGSAIREQLLAKPSVARRLLARVASLGAHLEPLRDARRGWGVAILALSKKCAELFAIVAIQLAFGLAPSVPVALLVLGALAVTTMLPIMPANLGVYEATVFATYRFTGTSAEIALGLAMVQHLCFLLPMLLTGYVTLTVRQLGAQRASAA
jgi:uncharacterized membrane protein YbhN (UPF0104 family)